MNPAVSFDWFSEKADLDQLEQLSRTEELDDAGVRSFLNLAEKLSIHIVQSEKVLPSHRLSSLMDRVVQLTLAASKNASKLARHQVSVFKGLLKVLLRVSKVHNKVRSKDVIMNKSIEESLSFASTMVDQGLTTAVEDFTAICQLLLDLCFDRQLDSMRHYVALIKIYGNFIEPADRSLIIHSKATLMISNLSSTISKFLQPTGHEMNWKLAAFLVKRIVWFADKTGMRSHDKDVFGTVLKLSEIGIASEHALNKVIEELNFSGLVHISLLETSTDNAIGSVLLSCDFIERESKTTDDRTADSEILNIAVNHLFEHRSIIVEYAFHKKKELFFFDRCVQCFCVGVVLSRKFTNEKAVLGMAVTGDPAEKMFCLEVVRHLHFRFGFSAYAPLVSSLKDSKSAIDNFESSLETFDAKHITDAQIAAAQEFVESSVRSSATPQKSNNIGIESIIWPCSETSALLYSMVVAVLSTNIDKLSTARLIRLLEVQNQISENNSSNDCLFFAACFLSSYLGDSRLNGLENVIQKAIVKKLIGSLNVLAKTPIARCFGAAAVVALTLRVDDTSWTDPIRGVFSKEIHEIFDAPLSLDNWHQLVKSFENVVKEPIKNEYRQSVPEFQQFSKPAKEPLINEIFKIISQLESKKIDYFKSEDKAILKLCKQKLEALLDGDT